MHCRLTVGCPFFTGKINSVTHGRGVEVEVPGGRQAAEYLKGAARLESLGEGLYKRRMLIIQKAHHKTLVFRVK